MTIDLTQIVIALIGVLGTIVTTCLVPYIKSKVTVNQYNTIRHWVNIAVEAAEKIYNESGMGAEKRSYVKNFLISKGFDLNDMEVEVMIESAVLEMQNAFCA